jgi:hypothetical protein
VSVAGPACPLSDNTARVDHVLLEAIGEREPGTHVKRTPEHTIQPDHTRGEESYGVPGDNTTHNGTQGRCRTLALRLERNGYT